MLQLTETNVHAMIALAHCRAMRARVMHQARELTRDQRSHTRQQLADTIHEVTQALLELDEHATTQNA